MIKNNENVSNGDDEVKGDDKNILELEKSDLFTFKLELKGDLSVHQRHLHSNKINNDEQQPAEGDPIRNMNTLDRIEVKNTIKPPDTEFKNEMGRNFSPIQLKNQMGKVLPWKGLISIGPSNSSQGACMPVPYLRSSANAVGLHEQVQGTTYGHEKESLIEEKEEPYNSSSPRKKQLKLGKKISPKYSKERKRKPKLNKSGTPELQKFFVRNKEKKALKENKKTPAENKSEEGKEIELKRKKKVIELKEKFEKENQSSSKIMKERKIMTPKRRKKSDNILKKEKKMDKKEDKVRTFNFEVLASKEKSQIYKSLEIKSLGKKQ